MISVVNNLERLARGVCLLWHFGIFAVLIMLESILRPILPVIDNAFDNYFSRTHKYKNAGEFLMIKFCQGMFDVLGIRILTTFNVTNYMSNS